MLNHNVTKASASVSISCKAFVPMLNHNVTKVVFQSLLSFLSFVPMLNHNVTKGQNSLYMIFIDSGRVQ